MKASVHLTGHWEEFVTENIRSGRYGTVSELVRAGLRLLEAESLRIPGPKDGRRSPGSKTQIDPEEDSTPPMGRRPKTRPSSRRWRPEA
ncbi:MAG: type II toxin-antitoxin system ParD family antitoxin [Actinobacteria bacterium]|nr:type II toxin-antitoxin system ParD family antitoxin [Actinomycetota bacterium]